MTSMSDHVTLSLDEVRCLSIEVLPAGGLSPDHAEAIADVIRAAQRDGATRTASTVCSDASGP